jgi:hypothetical protein
LSNAPTAVLKFDVFYLDSSFQNFQEDATIQISTDLTNWDIVEDLHGHGSWDTHTIDLSAYAGQPILYIAFVYNDDGGWLYGMAVDNVSIEVPSALDADLVELVASPFGEQTTPHPIEGTIFNNGITEITSLELTYTESGGSPVSGTLENLNLQPFQYLNFELPNPWVPSSFGDFTVDIEITAVNGTTDDITNNNSASFDATIYEKVIPPNKIEDFLQTNPNYSEIANASNLLNKPTDLDFFPIMGKDELWVINQRIENTGGSTVTISDATGVQDANHSGGSFTGPTLWSSDPAIYAQPSGGNGSHLDMLHGSPYSMGIAHEVDNVFWVYDDWHKDIVRYDFVNDHGPGNDYHGDAIVRRYRNLGINTDGDIPNHMILDKETGWMYFVDNGNDRVMRIDINSGIGTLPLQLINEQLTEHSQVLGFTSETIIDQGLNQPCGIEIFENFLLVGDYATGDVNVYDKDNSFEFLGQIPTNEPGLTGIKIGPDGNIWFTNRLQNTLMMMEPGNFTSTDENFATQDVRIFPNPSSGKIFIQVDLKSQDAKSQIRISDVTGRTFITEKNVIGNMEMDLSSFPKGIYLCTVLTENNAITKKITLN